MSENDLQQSHGVHVVHTGSRQAAPVLLIHGSGASGACWAPMIPALARGHHVVTIDLPGLGHSAPVTSYDIPAQAARVAAMIDALDVGPLVVVGHSSGGYVATSLAEQRPELVKAMALISTGPRLEALLPQRPLIRALSGPPLGRLIWALRSDKLIRKGINATCARQVDIPVELVADLRGCRTATSSTYCAATANTSPSAASPSGSPSSTYRSWSSSAPRTPVGSGISPGVRRGARRTHRDAAWNRPHRAAGST